MSQLHWATNLNDETKTRCGKTVAQVLIDDEDDVTSCPALDFLSQPDTCKDCVAAIKQRRIPR